MTGSCSAATACPQGSIHPASLWPTHEELDKIIAEENEWNSPLDVMLKNVAAKEKEEREKRLAKYVLPNAANAPIIGQLIG